MTNFFKFGTLALAAVAMASCGGDPVDPIPTVKTNKVISSNITSNTTWYADTVYQLGGRITVTSGATLTIQPGTVIKGEAGTGSNATALLIARGGKLMAEGTASLPIIFTSVADEITPEMVAAGNFASPNLDPTVNGLWGGVLILGNAKISPKPGTAGELLEVQIEGIPTSDANGLYGGNDDADNSGVLKYVSIRHGGTNIGSGNEINGLTLGGVGNGTVIENIEIVANQDDGIEYFGGTITTKNVISWNCGDDALDTDQSFGGTIDNFVVITPADHAFELDGPEGNYAAGHIIKNGNVIMSNADVVSHDLINTDANSIVDLLDIFFTDLVADNGTINRVTGNPGVTYTGIVIDVPAGDSLQTYVNGAIPAGVTSGTTGKANTSVFGWTWANAANVIK
ncbi:MAG: hypothetical protein ACO3HG_00955 [Schleiferiaceae bacterium]